MFPIGVTKRKLIKRERKDGKLDEKLRYLFKLVSDQFRWKQRAE